MLPDLNLPPPLSPPWRDLDGAPASPPIRRSPSPGAATSPPRSPRGALQRSLDELATVEAALVAAGISHAPQPGDLERMAGVFDDHPELSALATRLEDLVRRLAHPSDALQAALQQRAASGPPPGRVMTQLLAQIDAADDSDGEPDIDPLQADLAAQGSPLGHEIEAWARASGEPTGAAHAFDHEADATSFARMLARLRNVDGLGTSSSPRSLAGPVSAVVRAITEDADLRRQVFSMATDALGTCGDNLAEGFSKIRLAVDNHRMARAVQSGQIDAARLDAWAGALFRLSLLETAVHRFIHDQLQRPDLPPAHRHALTDEPVETMLHAKVALRQTLGLPDSTAADMSFRSVSALGTPELRGLAQQVRAQADDREARGRFLLNHDTWRTGMKALHRERFEALSVQQADDPFFDLDVPTDLAGQAAYAAQAREVQARHAAEEDALLLQLADEGGALPPPRPEGQGAAGR